MKGLELIKYLKGVKKDTLIVIVVALVVALSLFYPAMKKLFLIDKKVDMIQVQLNTVKESSDKSLSAEDVKTIVRHENYLLGEQLSKKIDGVYSAGMMTMANMNHNLANELMTVKNGTHTLLDALQHLQQDNEEQLRQFKYIDSLRRNFWEMDWGIGVKPSKTSRK